MEVSSAEIARRAGLSERSFSHYLNGSREPNLDSLVRIARALGCSPNDLLDFDDGSSPNSILIDRLVGAAGQLSVQELEIVAIQTEALAAKPKQLTAKRVARR